MFRGQQSEPLQARLIDAAAQQTGAHHRSGKLDNLGFGPTRADLGVHRTVDADAFLFRKLHSREELGQNSLSRDEGVSKILVLLTPTNPSGAGDLDGRAQVFNQDRLRGMPVTVSEGIYSGLSDGKLRDDPLLTGTYKAVHMRNWISGFEMDQDLLE